MSENNDLSKASGAVKNIYSIMVLIVFVVGLGITWGTLTSNISALETNFSEYKGATKESLTKLEGQVYQLELNKVGNDITIKNIDNSLKEIKETLKEIVKEGSK